MPFDWREYLELARGLVGEGGKGYSAEAAQRSAVSRAYYAAFCFARNYAKARYHFTETGRAEDHQRLREDLKRHGMAKMASRLNRLRIWRNGCDYEDRVANLDKLAWSAIQSADQVVRECR